MPYYIQRIEGQDKRTLETIDEFETRKESRAMLNEYDITDKGARHYISTRCCKHWKNEVA